MNLPTEADVDRVVPPGTLMHKWVELGKAQSDGHTLLHVGSYLATLSCLAPLCRLDASHAENNSAVYALLAGERGARDGTAVRNAERLVRFIDDRLLGPSPSSPGSLRDMLGHSSRPVLMVTENILKLTGGRGRMDYEHLLHEIWEGRDIRAWTSRGTHGPAKPRLGMISSVPMRTLKEDLLQEHMQSGTLRDHLVFLAPGRERQQPSVHGARTRDSQQVRALQLGLQELITRNADAFQVHTAYFGSDEARKAHADWSAALSARCDQEGIGAFRARAQRMAERVAMLLSWDFGKARILCDTQYEYPLGAAEVAIAFSVVYHLHLPGVWHLQRLAVRSEDMRVRGRILDLLSRASGWVPDGELYRHLKVTKRDALPVIETLQAEQLIDHMVTPGANDSMVTAYRLSRTKALSAADLEEAAAARGMRAAAVQPTPIRLPVAGTVGEGSPLWMGPKGDA